MSDNEAYCTSCFSSFIWKRGLVLLVICTEALHLAHYCDLVRTGCAWCYIVLMRGNIHTCLFACILRDTSIWQRENVQERLPCQVRVDPCGMPVDTHASTHTYTHTHKTHAHTHSHIFSLYQCAFIDKWHFIYMVCVNWRQKNPGWAPHRIIINVIWSFTHILVIVTMNNQFSHRYYLHYIKYNLIICCFDIDTHNIPYIWTSIRLTKFTFLCSDSVEHAITMPI